MRRLIVILIVLLLPTILFVPPAEALQEQVTVNLQPAMQVVDVHPGSTGVVVFSGTVDLTGVGPTTVPVVATLEATSKIGGSVTVSPSTVMLSTSQRSAPITVSVEERTGTSSTETDEITVGGTFTDGILLKVINQAKVSVIINQYYLFSLESENPIVEVEPDYQFNLDLTIENQGNGEDTFAVRVEDDNLEALTSKGWTVQLGTPKVVIDEKESKTIMLSAHSSSTAPIESEETLIIRVTSDYSGGVATEYYYFQIHVVDEVIILKEPEPVPEPDPEPIPEPEEEEPEDTSDDEDGPNEDTIVDDTLDETDDESAESTGDDAETVGEPAFTSITFLFVIIIVLVAAFASILFAKRKG